MATTPATFTFQVSGFLAELTDDSISLGTWGARVMVTGARATLKVPLNRLDSELKARLLAACLEGERRPSASGRLVNCVGSVTMTAAEGRACLKAADELIEREAEWAE